MVNKPKEGSLPKNTHTDIIKPYMQYTSETKTLAQVSVYTLNKN